jgi:hypothetical protein
VQTTKTQTKPTKDSDGEPVQVWLPRNVANEIRAIAARDRRSVSGVIRIAIEDQLLDWDGRR